MTTLREGGGHIINGVRLHTSCHHLSSVTEQSAVVASWQSAVKSEYNKSEVQIVFITQYRDFTVIELMICFSHVQLLCH